MIYEPGQPPREMTEEEVLMFQAYEAIGATQDFDDLDEVKRFLDEL